MPVVPIDAATVILTRNGSPPGTPWQCYMVRRHVKSDFAADVYVFPGGKVDAGDRSPALRRHSVGNPRPGAEDEDQWRAIRLAAIRELFEEVGVLLAGHADGSLVRMQASAADRYAGYRHGLHEGRSTLLEIAKQEKLAFRLDALSPISRWITPEGLPRRFDTRFFVAHAPTGQEPAHDERETTDGTWIAPLEALARYRRGEFPLVWATEIHLKRLARFPSVDGLLEAYAEADLTPVTPRIIDRDGVSVFLLPGDDGY